MPPKFKRNLSHEDLEKAQDIEKAELLAGGSDDDEDFFLKGPSPQIRSVTFQDDKLQEVQGQVGEVAEVMRENISRVLERGDKLTDLQDKSDNLNTNAEYFRLTSRRLQRNMWWREMKMRLILAVVIIVILLLIFVPIIIQQTRGG